MKSAYCAFFSSVTSLVTSLALTVILTHNAHSAEAPEGASGPCMKIMEACKAAGYNKLILNEKKSLSKNCLQPLLNEQKVEGVSVDSKDLAACKAKKAEVKLAK